MEARQIRARLGVVATADGSAYMEQGNTKVLAMVYGPHEVRRLPCRFQPSLILPLLCPVIVFIENRVVDFVSQNLGWNECRSQRVVLGSQGTPKYE